MELTFNRIRGTNYKIMEEKLDLLLEKVEENNRLLRLLIKMMEESNDDTKDFLINVGANIVGDILYSK